MSYIQPNSIVQLFKGISLDNRYMHTIYFANESAQNTWFSDRAFKTFQAQSYVRYTRNQIKLNCDVTEILGCPYMRFKNDRAVDKWFYAFINNVEYINENTALITYEIDVMQTWFIQVGSIKPCMVLREHVNNDTFGANLEEEPIGSEEYDCDFMSSFDEIFDGQKSVIINSTGRPQLPGACIVFGLFNGSTYAAKDANTTDDSKDIVEYLDGLLGDWDAGKQEQDIIDMYTVPKNLVQGTQSWTEFVHSLTRPSSYDNYTPKNKKLFKYPYSYLLCTTHNGQSATYKWEYFDSASIEFHGLGTPLGGGQVLAFPKAYNGQEDNMDCGLAITDFPRNPFTYDAYQAWIAGGGRTKVENAEEIVQMKGVSAELSQMQSIIGGTASASRLGTGIASGNVTQALGGVTSIANTAMGIVKADYDKSIMMKEAENKINYEWKDARYKPDIVVGKSTPSLAMGNNFLNYYFYHVHVRDDEVKRLDDFLTVFGYAVNRVKRPNLTGRRYWNFVQTQNCEIGGDMPASSKEAIGRIFDGGITFWHDGSQIGNYQQSVSDGTVNNPIV